MQSNLYPKGHLPPSKMVFPDGVDVARVVLRQMEVNEPILAVKVTEPGRSAGITSRLKRGMRAFTIKVDVASGVSGFLRPNDLVDICWTSTGDQINRGFTQLIQPGVEIIAIDQSATGEITGASVARTVTVQITPQDVALLAQAQTTGKLSLSLVGEGDDTVSGEIQVDQRQLLGISEPEPVVAQVEIKPAEEICTIRTRRGADVVEISIPCTN